MKLTTESKKKKTVLEKANVLYLQTKPMRTFFKADIADIADIAA